MPTYSKETALYDTGAISTDITEAGQTAGRYITAIDNSGIKVHAENNPNVNYSKIDANGLEVFKGTTVSNSESVAKFGDTARIGKEDSGHVTLTNNSFSIYGENTGAGFAVTNTTSTESDTVRDTIITRRNYGGVGTYTHTLKGYISGLSITISFSDPSGNITPISCTKTIPLSSFGSWSINSSDTGFKATGSVSYDSINKVVTLQVLTMTGQPSYRLTGFYATYTAYPQLATVSVGQNVDLSDKEIAFAVGHNTGNAFYVKRNGNVYANAISVDSNLNVNNELNARVYRGITETISISDSNFTTTTGSISSVDMIRFGNVVQLSMQVTKATATAAGSNVYAGTLKLTDYRPLIPTECGSYSGQICIIGLISTDGSILARVTGAQLPADRTPRLTFTYLI